VHARRVIFIDLARALAVVFMLYGHSIGALLAPEHRAGVWFDVWTFQRGLTSSLFLLLSGFAFSVATARRWSSHVRPSRQMFTRVRRFLTFALLGYALHFPVPRFADLATISDAQWRSFLAVDVLQLIGTTFIIVQLIVLLTRSRRVFTVVSLILASVVVFTTPRVWTVDWTQVLPLWASSFLMEATGSQFPLFPWAGYILLGIGLGQIYGRWGASNLRRYANVALLLPGVLLIAGGLALRPIAASLFGPDPPSFVPPEVLVRAGTCLIICGTIAHASNHITGLPRVFGALAQETLLIYFVHLCIVYGSIWNPGLFQLYGATLSPLQVLTVVLVLISAMTALAWQWNWLKHTSSRTAQWVAVTVGSLMVVSLVW
jgi:uncharacterized membrane protein